MNIDHLTRVDGPQEHLLVASPETTHHAFQALSGQAIAGKSPAVRFVRGDKATTLAGFYDEISAALQFPHYFGRNWDALSDCLRDFSWLHGPAAIVVVLSNSDQLLSAATLADRQTFRQVLDDACQYWKSKNVAFHIVFQGKKLEDIKQPWGALTALKIG